METAQNQYLDEDEGLTETQKAMKKMKANMSVINGNSDVRNSPLKSRRLSVGGSSRGVSTP